MHASARESVEGKKEDEREYRSFVCMRKIMRRVSRQHTAAEKIPDSQEHSSMRDAKKDSLSLITAKKT